MNYCPPDTESAGHQSTSQPVNQSTSQPILTLTGPTASGKTALSLKVAEALDGEIVSVDSRQIYEELNIGTAKPTKAELKRVRHHFISEFRIEKPLSAGQYAELAQKRIAAIIEKGKTPIVVGGSTLYLHALQHGLSDIPSVSEDVRDRLIQRLNDEGSEALYEELLEIDPTSARTMDPTKSQRIVRALEVYHGTGRPLSSYHSAAPPPLYDYTTFVLTMDRRRLYDRIEQRVDRMLEAGLVEEVRRLMASSVDVTLPVLRTIGYREVIEHLQGAYDYDEMVRLIKRNTRRYAKRQLTWLRRFDAYRWIDLDASHRDPLEAILTDPASRQTERP